MFTVCVTFDLAPDSITDFLVPMKRQAKTSVENEPGCLRFDVCWESAAENRVFLYEIYQNEAAFQTHLESEHFAEFNQAIEDMVLEKSVVTYSQVSVNGK
ncbi:MAG: putative quinol monooxygenase [Pseudomonadota bacterium]